MEKSVSTNVSLKPYNSFGVEANAHYFFEAKTMDDLLWIVHDDHFKLPKLILGGGSNVLLTKDFEGLVLKISFKEKWIEKSNEDHTLVSVMGGEVWHTFVQWTIQNGLGGLENLSLIPGNVGTTPVQNIGAYGVEIKDTFHHLEALNVETGEFEIFRKEECDFGYRHSIFKTKGKGKYIITRVFFQLTNRNHQLNTSYGAINKELETIGKEASIQSISEAVINIRSSKLPNPAVIGNGGSFFKNPVVANSQFLALKEEFPEMVGYPSGSEQTKLAAGWMIEKAGWKNYRKGDAGVYEKQALVLVNHGNATGKEVLDLSIAIRKSVNETFGVILEPEINIL